MLNIIVTKEINKGIHIRYQMSSIIERKILVFSPHRVITPITGPIIHLLHYPLYYHMNIHRGLETLCFVTIILPAGPPHERTEPRRRAPFFTPIWSHGLRDKAQVYFFVHAMHVILLLSYHVFAL